LQAQEAAQQSSENGVNNLITIIIILAIIIVALASLTIYIKRKSKEPYIVIHKESPIKNLDEEQNGTDTQ
jgi:flagellar basal body-associated protein FliL